jgi:hypothetical protein
MTNGLRALAVVVAGIALETSLGCILGCGVAADPDDLAAADGGAIGGQISDAGVVEFAPTVLGATTHFTIPVKDTADVDETLLGASFSGPDAAAFQVVATFPIPIPAGTPITLEIEFTPTLAGSSSATLDLQTADMGVSPIEIEGTGVTDGGE